MRWILVGLLCVMSTVVFSTGEHNVWLKEDSQTIKLPMGQTVPQLFGFRTEIEPEINKLAREWHAKRCFYRIDKYKKKLKRYPDSRYYKGRMKVWVSRCEGVYPSEDIPEEYRLPEKKKGK